MVSSPANAPARCRGRIFAWFEIDDADPARIARRPPGPRPARGVVERGHRQPRCAWPSVQRVAPDEETVRRRLEAIDALGAGEPVVCFTSWTAMTRPTLAREALRRWVFTLKPGQTYAVDDLVRRLTTLGYRREALVQGRGEFSLRGGILDCFPPDRRRPVRSEFFGDELEPLREIDFSRTLPEVRDQWLTDTERVRSGAYFDGIEGFQAYLDPTQPTLFDHLPKDALILSLDGRRSLTQAEQR